MHRASSGPRNPEVAGFTLAELMVAMAVFSLLAIGVTRFMIDGNLLILSSTAKLDINSDIRKFTDDLAREARAANGFVLYRSIYPVETDSPRGDFRNPMHGFSPGDYHRQAGESGDLLVLVYERPDPLPHDREIPLARLVGYYRDARDIAAGQAPVKRFEIVVPEADRFEAIEDLIPPAHQLQDAETVVSLAEGLANGMLFHNFNARSVLVNAKIVHGNLAKQITGTYNFTVSPRG